MVISYNNPESDKEKPFSMAYETEAVILVQVTIMFNFHTEERIALENLGILKSDLDFAEERRECAQVRLATYQQQIRSYYKKCVKPRSLQVGDLWCGIN
ncbi:hypothetical protein FF2_019220 [Malus domestica]